MLTYRGSVYPWHCDQIGHMNVMHYVGMFDQATWQLFNAIGLRPAWLRSANRGMAAVEQKLNYLRELHAGAVLSISSRLLEVHERRLVLAHEMRNDDSGEIAARCVLVGVHLDTVARKAVALPDEVQNAARALIAQPSLAS